MEWDRRDDGGGPLAGSPTPTNSAGELVGPYGSGLRAEGVSASAMAATTAAPPAPPGTKQPGSGRSAARCRVPNCTQRLLQAYNQRHRICRVHQKAAMIECEGATWRFCQQCAKLQPIDAFEGEKRSCTASLQQQKERRQMRLAQQPAAAGQPAGQAAQQPASEALAAEGSAGREEEEEGQQRAKRRRVAATVQASQLELEPEPSPVPPRHFMAQQPPALPTHSQGQPQQLAGPPQPQYSQYSQQQQQVPVPQQQQYQPQYHMQPQYAPPQQPQQPALRPDSPPLMSAGGAQQRPPALLDTLLLAEGFHQRLLKLEGQVETILQVLLKQQGDGPEAAGQLPRDRAPYMPQRQALNPGHERRHERRPTPPLPLGERQHHSSMLGQQGGAAQQMLASMPADMGPPGKDPTWSAAEVAAMLQLPSMSDLAPLAAGGPAGGPMQPRQHGMARSPRQQDAMQPRGIGGGRADGLMNNLERQLEEQLHMMPEPSNAVMQEAAELLQTVLQTGGEVEGLPSDQEMLEIAGELGMLSSVVLRFSQQQQQQLQQAVAAHGGAAKHGGGGWLVPPGGGSLQWGRDNLSLGADRSRPSTAPHPGMLGSRHRGQPPLDGGAAPAVSGSRAPSRAASASEAAAGARGGSDGTEPPRPNPFTAVRMPSLAGLVQALQQHPPPGQQQQQQRHHQQVQQQQQPAQQQQRMSAAQRFVDMLGSDQDASQLWKRAPPPHAQQLLQGLPSIEPPSTARLGSHQMPPRLPSDTPTAGLGSGALASSNLGSGAGFGSGGRLGSGAGLVSGPMGGPRMPPGGLSNSPDGSGDRAPRGTPYADLMPLGDAPGSGGAAERMAMPRWASDSAPGFA